MGGLFSTLFHGAAFIGTIWGSFYALKEGYPISLLIGGVFLFLIYLSYSRGGSSSSGGGGGGGGNGVGRAIGGLFSVLFRLILFLAGITLAIFVIAELRAQGDQGPLTLIVIGMFAVWFLSMRKGKKE